VAKEKLEVHRKTMKLRDSFTGRDYLVDLGAELCVIPASAEDKKNKSDNGSLIAANGSKILSYGKRKLALQFDPSRFTQSFVVADVSQPILGANFFAKNHLLIDLARSQIVQAEDWVEIPASPCTNTSTEEAGLHEIRRSVYEALLANYPERLVHTIHPNANILHSTEHHIDTTGAPSHARARHLDGEKL
jgi:hypothetical protein